ncbi:MAG TPA: HAMP domain-containing sensor histidine kinase [Clostridiaceae bacterium]
MNKLKNWPLSLQIWMIFTSVIVIIFVLLSIYFSISIRSLFTNEIYTTIETAQENSIQKSTDGVNSTDELSIGPVSNDIREVSNIKFNYTNDAANQLKIAKFMPNKVVGDLFLKKLKKQAQNQTSVTQRYIERTGSGRILYVIRVNGINKKGNFIVSYMWDTYRNSLVSAFMKKLFAVMIIALIISLMAAKYLAHKLTVPLRELDKNVKNIGSKQWHESINLDRNDEIGELSKSIEAMRVELIKQDEYEQTMLQQASHDLKTPLMVIRSYAKAVEDGIYPKGTLESTMKVINAEAERMEKRIKNLLYFTKIKYISKHPKQFKEINIKNLVEGIVDNFIYNEKDIRFVLDIKDIKVKADDDQLTVVFENLIDNELRYAKSLIKITIYEEGEQQYIIIYNDGIKIPDNKLSNIFGVFEKDKGGNFGLGLDIVKKIVNMYNGNIIAQNEEIGVSFIITLRKHK